MARDSRPPQRTCPKCGGKGWQYDKKKRVVHGKATTEKVQSPCRKCDGVGWVNR